MGELPPDGVSKWPPSGPKLWKTLIDPYVAAQYIGWTGCLPEPRFNSCFNGKSTVAWSLRAQGPDIPAVDSDVLPSLTNGGSGRGAERLLRSSHFQDTRELPACCQSHDGIDAKPPLIVH